MTVSGGIALALIIPAGSLAAASPCWPFTAAAAQADAHVCLLDALGIRRAAVMGGSAGAPSALQMAIRHPDRVSAMLDNILPVSARAEGLRSDSSVGKHLASSPLEAVHVPTLIVSARDDNYGTYASAQYTASRIAGAKFVGFDQGGHVWVGHNDEVMAEILKLLDLPVRP